MAACFFFFNQTNNKKNLRPSISKTKDQPFEQKKKTFKLSSSSKQHHYRRTVNFDHQKSPGSPPLAKAVTSSPVNINTHINTKKRERIFSGLKIGFELLFRFCFQCRVLAKKKEEKIELKRICSFSDSRAQSLRMNFSLSVGVGFESD